MAFDIQQQERFEQFVHEFNHERPHEALEMKCPADVYRRSKRLYPKIAPELTYEDCDDILRVTKNGYVCFGRRIVYVSQALSQMHVGVTEQRNGKLLLRFIDLDLGTIDQRSTRLTPLNPTP